MKAGSEPREMPEGVAHLNGPILSYADVVQTVAPAVVTIRASHRVRAPQQFPFFNSPFFQQFFGGGVPNNQNKMEEELALGSGVIVRPDGHILTNYHVIDGAQEIKVDLTNQHTYSAKVVGSDEPSDLAVLKISASGLPVLQLGDSDKVRVGDVCLAVGNPLGVGQSVTQGIISAKGRTTDILGSGSFEDFLQTDAAINKGNSGGALVNTRGELIGINSQILSSNGGFIGIGFAIPSNMAKNVMDQLIQKGKVQRGMLGVTIQPVTSDLAAGLGLKQVGGVLVSSVVPGGPAAQAGIKQGDVILQLNGTDVNDTNELRNDVAADSPGTEVTLTISRNGKQEQVKVRLGALTPEAAQQTQSSGPSGKSNQLGVTVEPLTSDLAAQLGLSRTTQGVAIDSVDPNGPAAQAGLQAGDVIQQANQRPVHSAAELQSALQSTGNRPALLLVNRGGQKLYVAVPLK
ncbi:MAG TPA: DegQ family serine endoprotease [Bryobacteraceae bacterium]|nr:DegQ family serine endoprotease [Bryobacteraceae bacterium]